MLIKWYINFDVLLTGTLGRLGYANVTFLKSTPPLNPSTSSPSSDVGSISLS